MASYSAFWGGNGYANLYSRSHISMKMRMLLRKVSNLEVRDQLVDLIAASTSTQGSVTRKQLQADTAPVSVGAMGGARTIETKTLESATANTTGGTIKVAASAKAWPATYPANGNGLLANTLSPGTTTYSS